MNGFAGEPFHRGTGLMNMETRARSIAVIFGLLAYATGLQAADFELTPAELAGLERGETVIRANLDAGQRRGTVRAALLIEAPPAVVFQAMTQCADALRFVPHLRSCRSVLQPGEPGISLVEHEVDFGWYAPRVKYVLRADVVVDQSITFRQVSGDFKANEGRWELEPADDGSHTVLLYRAYLDPPGYIPNWVLRSRFRREMPQMLTDLRKRCETEQTLRAKADHAP
jgi:ribosome-associated toxin RatA of RatAB toxin-antitoxin module